MVRHVYMDEGGRGASSNEPFSVEAAVILNLDVHLRPVVERMSALAEKYLPPDKQRMPFHAMSIWHGTKDIHRDRLSRQQRLQLLEDSADIPRTVGIPVICGGWFKEWIRHPIRIYI